MAQTNRHTDKHRVSKTESADSVKRYIIFCSFHRIIIAKLQISPSQKLYWKNMEFSIIGYSLGVRHAYVRDVKITRQCSRDGKAISDLSVTFQWPFGALCVNFLSPFCDLSVTFRWPFGDLLQTFWMLIFLRGQNVSFDNFAQEIALKLLKVNLKRVEIWQQLLKVSEKHEFLRFHEQIWKCCAKSAKFCADSCACVRDI